MKKFDTLKNFSWFRGFPFGVEFNSTAEDTKQVCVRLFGKAKSSLFILSGNLNSEFYDDRRILKALGTAAKKEVSIAIAYCKSPKVKMATDIFAEIPQIHFYELSERAQRHFMVIDGSIVRIEDIHKDDSSRTPAVILYEAQELAKELESQFNRVCNLAQA